MQSDAHDSSLLTTALEKLLYLESRLEAAEAGREEAVRERERQRIAAQAARQALIEWQKRAADAEVAAEGAERQAVLLRDALGRTREPAPDSEALRDARDRIARYEREREVWLDRMVVLGRLSHEGDELDLGSFIAELRAELLALRRGETGRKGATVSDRPARPDPGQILEEAPPGAANLDPEALLSRARMSRPERTLAAICGRDLRSDSASVRRRAAERLAEGRVAALGPIAVEMMPGEPDPHVRVALVKLLDAAEAETCDIALSRALSDPDARVRTAALESLSRRGLRGLNTALADPDAAVRRRAITLLPRSSEALDYLTQALTDSDASVRHVAALALTRHVGTEADGLLRGAAESSDGEVSAVARTALVKRGLVAPAALAPVVVVAAPQVAPPPAPEPTPELAESAAFELDSLIVAEIRTALRGRSPEELAERIGTGIPETQAAVDRLITAERLLWRGRKLYLA